MRASVLLRRLPIHHHPASPRPTARLVPSPFRPSLRSASSVVTLSDGDAVSKFRSINGKSVLYFTATWCPPCKMISPVYDGLSEQHPDVAFGKIDVDENQDAAAEYRIEAVPTFVLAREGETTGRISGADRDQLEKLVQEL
ncbi:hypothetical protein ACHAWF_004557 [Thalassiosira exigua]